MALRMSGPFVGGQVVEDDDVAGEKRRTKNLLHIGEEPGAGHGSVQTPSAQSCQRAAVLPVKVVVFQWPWGTPASETVDRAELDHEAAPSWLPAPVSSMKTSRCRVEIELTFEPGLTSASGCRDGPCSAACARLFLTVIFRRAKNRHRLETATATPLSASKARSSTKVMSGLASTACRMTGAQASIRPDR